MAGGVRLGRRRLVVMTVGLVAVMMAARRAAALTFDVVSVKEDKSLDGPFTLGFPTVGDGFYVRYLQLQYVVQVAYDFHRGDLISGMPEWGRPQANGARFDIQAKVAAADLAEWRGMSDGDRRVMVQGILVDRFKLKIHHEPKVVAVFELVVAKGGAKIKEAGEPGPSALKAADGSVTKGMFRTGFGQYTAQGTDVKELALTLSDYTGRQVIDKTGLAGSYDFVLRFVPEPGYGSKDQQRDSATANASGPSVYTAVQEQLGLRLEPAKTAVDGLVIDRVERPTED